MKAVWISLLFIEGECGDPPLRIPQYDVLTQQYKHMYLDGSFYWGPAESTSGGAAVIPSGWAKENRCVDGTWSELNTIRGSGRLSAGLVQVGGHSRVDYVYLAVESEFLLVPKNVYKDIVGVVDNIAVIEEPESPIIFQDSLISSLPTIRLQLANSKVVYSITPAAYATCEKGDSEPGEPRKCMLLIKESKLASHWTFGRPFLNHVVSLISIGDVTPFYHMCAPVEHTLDFVTFEKTDSSVSMPWSFNDYLLVAGVVLIVLIILAIIMRDRMLVCRRRRNARSSIPAPVTEETSPLITTDQPGF